MSNNLNKNDADYFEVCERYPQISHFLILKIELQRRGFILSDSALSKVNANIHQTQQRSISRESHGVLPVSLMLRDGTSVVVRPLYLDGLSSCCLLG